MVLEYFLQRFSVFFFILFFLFPCLIAADKKHFVIVTASYNNADWYKKNLSTLFDQDYDNWSLIYINDCSDDGTGELVERYVASRNMHHKVSVIHNTERKGHCYNQYHAIHSCPDEAIIVIIDGDDWLAHNKVLSHLNKVYQDDIWITYGQFKYVRRGARGCSREIPHQVLKTNAIRQYGPWVTSHLRTFYAGLYKKIKKDHLMINGSFLPMAVDVATMFPMIEMAQWHSKFIPHILYMYNDTNQLSFFHDRRERQREIFDAIRAYQPYRPLIKVPY